MLTIEQIREHQFVGNAYSDHDIFAAIHEFAIDESQPVAHRAEALWIMGDRGMGLTIEEFDPELPADWRPGVHANLDAATVERYMKEVREGNAFDAAEMKAVRDEDHKTFNNERLLDAESDQHSSRHGG